MKFETIPAKNIDDYIKQSKTLIIDLRERREYLDGHIVNSVNIPFEQLENNINRIPKDYQLVLYCERGGVSLIAAKELSKLGYNVKTVVGGLNAYRGKYITK